jgi:hypothetical protein
MPPPPPPPFFLGNEFSITSIMNHKNCLESANNSAESTKQEQVAKYRILRLKGTITCTPSFQSPKGVATQLSHNPNHFPFL